MNRMRKALCLGLAAVMTAGCCITASANGAVTSDEVTERETRNSEISMNLATQGMVLLQNNNNALPIASGGNIAVFGTGAERTVKGGTGSGDVNQREVVSVAQGFRNAGFNVTTQSYIDAYEAAYQKANEGYTGFLGSSIRAPEIEITSQMMTAAKAGGTQTAVYVLGRIAGEGADRTATEGDYLADANEIANLKKIAENFDKVILVLNVGGAIDTKFIRENTGIDSVVVMGQAGQRGGDALVKVLTGEVTPSGKLTASWPENYSDLPDAKYWGANDGNIDQEDYEDGIYVGYRYYDTFNVTPAYEFGYGMSYTTFDMKTNYLKVTPGNIAVNVTVTNTGKTYSGKEVVQIYFSAPDGALEKPYQELAAFGKTNDLAPGESQTLEIGFTTTEMSSYDTEKAAYVMEDGDYIIRVGNSSRNTHVAAVIQLDKDVITEQLSNQLPPDEEIKELSSKGVTSYSYAGEAEEIKNAPVIKMSASSVPTSNHASPYDSEDSTVYVSDTTEQEYLNSNLGYQLDGSFGGKYPNHPSEYQENVVELDGDFSKSTLKEVYDGKITLEQFVSGLTVSQMADIVIGGNKLPVQMDDGGFNQAAGAASANSAGVSDGTMIGAQANAVAGAAGETAGIYIESKDIPNIVLADGPAGLRITQQRTVGEGDDAVTYYQYCTAFPSGTVLTQSWDPDVAYAKGAAVGEELVEYGVTLWLAPGMNIQKNPLCGRNFEYYSEDPFLAGIVGINETLGVQSHPGVGVTIKHFYGNSQEDNRNAVNNTISERASREIYLKQFEMVVKAARPMAIMSSYNQNNGVPDADDYDLLIDITRGEWGFDGLVMTDWGGGQSTPAISMHAGNDLIMPGSSVEDITIKAFSDQEPVFAADDVYPEVTVQTLYGFWTFANTAWGEFNPSADGDVEIVKTVPTATYEAAKRAAVVDGQETEVAVSELIAGLGNAVTVKTEGSNTVITYKGYYTNNNISLGDLQRSTANILKIVMASNQFADMFSDVEAQPYSAGYSMNAYLSIK